jgi:hypothetical protein
MFPDSGPTPQSQALDDAGTDADVMGGPSEASDPVSPCPAVPKGPLWVRLDLTPEQAASDPGSLRLRGGGYDSAIAIAGGFKANPDPDNTVDIVFEEVPTQGSYTLTYVGNGEPVALVQGASYTSLQDDSLPPENEGTADTSPEQAS